MSSMVLAQYGEFRTVVIESDASNGYVDLCERLADDKIHGWRVISVLEQQTGFANRLGWMIVEEEIPK